MSDSFTLPSYSRFEQALESIGLDLGASEIHGVLCGLICAGTAQAHIEWIEELFKERSADDLLVGEARQMLGQLYLASRQQIGDEGLEFIPLLPDDDEPLARRAEALVEWCEGYLYGLGMAGVTEQQLLGDAKEALKDISEFTRLDLDALQEGDSDESAYMQLQEFLRVATLLIREELASVQESR
jgi:yecA family protein